MPGYTSDKEDVLARLKRVEGQVRGIERMIDEDTYCIDVLTQIASVTKALQMNMAAITAPCTRGTIMFILIAMMIQPST